MASDTRHLTQQCTGTNRDGEQCGSSALAGAVVCRKHGGAAPHVKEAAAKRLTEGSLTAADILHKLMKDRDEGPECPFCKRGMPRDDNILLRAATAILDRTGLGPSAKLEVDASVDIAFLEYLTDEQLAQIDKWIDEAIQRAAHDVGEDL